MKMLLATILPDSPQTDHHRLADGVLAVTPHGVVGHATMAG